MNKETELLPACPHSACLTCDQIRIVLKDWMNQQVHDKCWYYPEVFRHICVLLNISVDHVEVKKVPFSKEEFQKGCMVYTEELHFG